MADNLLSSLTGRQVFQYYDPSGPAAGDIFFSMAATRTGCYIADGADYSQTTDAELFAAIGTSFNTQINPTTGSAWAAPAAGRFRVPDMRGVVARGAGTPHNGSALSVGAYEADQFQGHNHSFATNIAGTTPAAAGNRPVGATTAVSGDIGGVVGNPTNGSNGTVRFGDETRVKARGGNWFVRRFNPTPQVIGAGEATATKSGLVSGGKVPGQTTGIATAAGNIGELVRATQPVATNFPASNTYGDATFIDLTPGVWAISPVLDASAGGGNISTVLMGVSTTTGNSGTGLVDGDNFGSFLPPTAASNITATLSNVPVVISTTTRYYLKVRGTYTTGTPQYRCRLSAVRVG